MFKWSSRALKSWVMMGVGALVLALSAFFILSTFSPDSTFAQAPNNMIKYAENGIDPVRTFSSEDPEGAGINWDVTGIDADYFEISGGVLTFKNPPDYENMRDMPHRALDRNRDGDDIDTAEGIDVAEATAADNKYQITVRASEMRESGYMGRALSTETHLTIAVTNEPEDGTVTIDLRQPEVGTRIKAMITDPDGGVSIDTQPNGWKWYVSTVTNPIPDADNHWAEVTGATLNEVITSYTPKGVRARPPTGTTADEGKYLRAVALYVDASPVDASGPQPREAIGVSEFPVRAEVSTDNDADSNPANGSPGFTQGVDYTRTVSESLGKGMNVGARVGAIDPNKEDKLTYEIDNDSDRSNSILNDEDVSYFSIDKATGQLKVKKTLDWDNNPDSTNPDGKYTFKVRAIDPSGETAEVDVTVTATDANDAPKIMGSRTAKQTGGSPIPAAPSEIRVLEQDSDDRNPPAGPDDTYDGTPKGVAGKVDEAMGLPVALALGNQNVFTAPDEDERGQIFWGLKGDDKDAFVLTQGGQADTGGQGALTGPDEPIALVFVTPPDYENPTDADGDSVYKVVLEARDSGGLIDSRPITIFVDNETEQGEATLSATGNGVDQPTIGSEITADVVDPDGGVAVLTWQWSKSGTANGTFTIIYGETSSAYTPKDDDDGQYLKVTATYIDTTSEMDDPDTGNVDERVQESNEEAHTATLGDGVYPSAGDEEVYGVFRVSVTSKFAVRVAPGDPPSTTAPTFQMETYERLLAENAEVWSIVGAPVRVQPQKGISFQYDLDATTTNDDNFFTIDSRHGQIRVGEINFRSGRADIDYPDEMANATPGMEDPVLDFEGTNVFRLVITATDSANNQRKAKADVTIRLTDLNEKPYFDKASQDDVADKKDYAESRGNRVVPLAATEPDGDSLRWEVAGTDAPDFEIKDVSDIGDGKDRVELHFKSEPDYEDPTARGNIGSIDRAERNQYSIIVRAIETTAVGGGPNQAAELPVKVQVVNSDEPGKVEMKWLQPEVGTALPATLTDPDGNPGADLPLPVVMADGDTTINNEHITSWQWYRAKNSIIYSAPKDAGELEANWEAITDLSAGDTIAETYVPAGKKAMANDGTPTGIKVDENWKLLVKAEYTDGEGGSKSAFGVTYKPVRADVHDDRNNSPDFAQDTAARSVPENTAVGANVGGPVKVNTNEDNDVLTYTLDNDKDPTTDLDSAAGDDLVGNAASGKRGDVSYFSIDKETGQIKVAKPLDWDNNPKLPEDAKGEYVLWVRATDPSGENTDDEDNDYIKVTITATDVNDAPKVTNGLAEISINEVDSSKKDSGDTKFVGLGYELTDTPQARTIISTDSNLYHRDEEDRVDRGEWPEPIAGPDGSLFEYSTPEGGIGRRLLFKKTNLPDYENPGDANRDNVYEVTVTVRDNSGATGTKKVRITVTNVDEMGKLVLSPEQPNDGVPVTAALTDADGVEIITDWTWYTATTRLTKGVNDVSAIRDGNGDIKSDLTKVLGATTDKHTGKAGQFLWAEVAYRDGKSVEDDPVTALDERNNDPASDLTEHHKLQNMTNDDPPAPDSTDDLYYHHNSDRMLPEGADNAVRKDPASGDDPDTPSTDLVLQERTVYENVPSTGYVGIPLDAGYVAGYEGIQKDGLSYPDGKGGTGTRDTIGGPDGASFVFAEDEDGATAYYDQIMVDSDDISSEQPDPTDKAGQLAAAVVTHFDYEGDKNTYIIEVTDPNAEVAVGAMRVTINVMNVNEAPSAPEEMKSGIAIPRGGGAANYDEMTDAAATTWNAVATYPAQGPQAASAVWTLNGADAAALTITAKDGDGMDAATGASAELTFNAAPDYEMPTDADTDNVYMVTVMARGGIHSVSRDVTVTVMNVDEDGTVTFDSTAAVVGTALTASLTDPDGNAGDPFPIMADTTITGATWQWAMAEAADGTFTDISGATNAAYTPVAADDGKFLKATAMYADMEGSDKEATAVTSAVGVTPTTDSVALYDTDGTDGIQKAEFETALRDYIFNETLDKAGFEQVLRSYLGL